MAKRVAVFTLPKRPVNICFQQSSLATERLCLHYDGSVALTVLIKTLKMDIWSLWLQKAKATKVTIAHM